MKNALPTDREVNAAPEMIMSLEVEVESEAKKRFDEAQAQAWTLSNLARTLDQR